MCVAFISFSKICNLWGCVFLFQTNIYFIHIFGFFFLTRIPPYYVNSRAHKAWISFLLRDIFFGAQIYYIVSAELREVELRGT